MKDQPHGDRGLSRRDFLRGGMAVGLGTAALGAAAEAAQDENAEGATGSGRARRIRGKTEVVLRVDGQDLRLAVEPRTSLLSALRDHAPLDGGAPNTGPKLVCDGGNCGACTVLLDGRPAAACMVLAHDVGGQEVRTVRGIGGPDAMSDLQQAFCDHDGMMCGFCTPGFVTALTAELERNPGASEQQLREACAGNLCRCGTYPQVFEAALAVAKGERR